MSGAALEAPDQGLGAEEIGHPRLNRLMIRVVIRENACPNWDEGASYRPIASRVQTAML
jgi:hypothetical protein